MHTSARMRRAAALGSVILATTALASPAPSAATAGPRPDLVVAAVANPPAKAKPGTSFSTTSRIKNVGAGRAGRSTVGYYLSRDKDRGRGDLRLGGAALAPLVDGESVAPRTRLTIPGSTPAGSYYVLGCADDAGRVREVKETNNCRASARKVTVSAPFKGNLEGTLTFRDTGDETDNGTRHTWERSVEVRIRIDVRGSRPGFEQFTDDGSSYGWVGVDDTVDNDPSCLVTSHTDEHGAGGFLQTGDPFTDEISGHFGHVDYRELDLGLHIRYERTTTRKQSGRGEFPCEDSQTVEGPVTSLNVNDVEFAEISRTTTTITYRAVEWKGPQNQTSDWDAVDGRLVLSRA